LILVLALLLMAWGGVFLTAAVGTDVYGDDPENGATETSEQPGDGPPPDTEPPAPPTGLTVYDPGDGTAIYLSWNPNTEPDLLGYRVYRAVSTEADAPPDDAYQRLGSGMIDTEVPEYTDNTVVKDVYYFYRVTAVDQAGNESGRIYSDTVVEVDVTPPAPPLGLKARERDNGKEVILQWLANTEPDLAGYQLYRATDAAGPFELIKTLDRSETQCREDDLAQGQWYYYYLHAVDETGNVSDQSPVVSARPRQAVKVGFKQDDAQMPAYLYMEPDCSAVFLNIPGDHITVRVRALDENGAEVPLYGDLRFAAAFGRFKNPGVTGAGTAEAVFTAQEIGGGEIAVEYYPAGAEEPALVDATNVRALEWHLSFSISGNRTETGASDIDLEAYVTGQDGLAVTDGAAKVAFETVTSPDPHEKNTEKRRAGRWHGPAHANVVRDGRRTGATAMYPDANGEIHAEWVASTVPGATKLQAVLYYDDARGREPKLVRVSGIYTVEVVPGPARYVGFDPANVSFAGKRPEKVTVLAFDAFGNVVTDYGDDLKVWVQVPLDTPVTFSVDNGDSWVAPGIWEPVDIGQKLLVRGTADLSSGKCALVTRVEGESLDPPPGVAQVNLPLVFQ
jgi:hypothetical protein